MRNAFKTALAVLLAVLMLAALCACGGRINDSRDTEPAVSNTPKSNETAKKDKEISKDNTDKKEIEKNPVEKIVVHAWECAEGCQVLLANRSTTADVTELKGAEEVEWKIYVLTQKPTEPIENAISECEPVLTSGGHLELIKGQYIVVCCSSEGELADDGAEGPSLVFYARGLTR